ncbi:MAG: MarR family transcriptional regulator [Pelagibacteraceae bacterium]|jgi:DNA-binding MarR family transcriptional regulator
MKELLYLKDEQIKDFIQLLFYAYRETFSDPKEILAKNSFGPAHLRALNLIERNPGTNLGELMYQLKITKQSLNRVLRDLIKTKMIKQIRDDEDTRKKNLFLDKEGKIFFEKIYDTQKKRIFNALKNSEPDSVIKFKEVLNKIIHGTK